MNTRRKRDDVLSRSLVRPARASYLTSSFRRASFAGSSRSSPARWVVRSESREVLVLGRRRGLVARRAVPSRDGGVPVAAPVAIGRHSRRKALEAGLFAREDDAAAARAVPVPGALLVPRALAAEVALLPAAEARVRAAAAVAAAVVPIATPSGAAIEAIGGPAAAIAGLAALAPTAVALVPSSSAASAAAAPSTAVVSVRGAAGVGARRGVEPAALVAAVAPPALVVPADLPLERGTAAALVRETAVTAVAHPPPEVAADILGDGLPGRLRSPRRRIDAAPLRVDPVPIVEIRGVVSLAPRRRTRVWVQVPSPGRRRVPALVPIVHPFVVVAGCLGRISISLDVVPFGVQRRAR